MFNSSNALIRAFLLVSLCLSIGLIYSARVAAVTPSANDVAVGSVPNGVITVTDAGMGSGYSIPLVSAGHNVTGTPTNGSGTATPAWMSKVQYLSDSYENGIIPPVGIGDSYATEIEWSDDIQITVTFPTTPGSPYTINMTDTSRIRWDYTLDATLSGSFSQADLRTYDAPVRVDDGAEPTWSEINHWTVSIANNKITNHEENPDHSRSLFSHDLVGAATPATSTVAHFRADSRVNAVHNCSSDGGDGKTKVISKTVKWDINTRKFGLTITP